MIESVNLFDGHIPYYKITKPVRLIELFAGIGSQHQALKNLGVKIDRSTIVEWQVNSIQAYNDIHIRKYDDWTQGITKEELAYRLNQLGVSIDYNEPVKLESLMRKGEEWLRNVYNNIINTNNKVNIMSVKGSHLNIIETDKYDYILTYSFPCQDLSKAGKGKGMSDTTTRSGLLWEVERILSELDELPQILLMENVPDVIGSKFIKDFQRWESRLRELGYSNHTEILNSKDFGIPQNRERAFMVSILGSSLYHFPQKQPLKLRLKDMLEPKVDEKYYLSDVFLDRLENVKSKDKRLPEILDKIDYDTDEPQSLDLYNRTVSNISQTLTMPNHNAQAIAVKETKEYANYITWLDDKGRLNTQDHRAYFEDRLSGTIPAMERGVPNVLLTPINENYGMLNGGKWDNLNESSRRVYNENYVSPTITTMAGGNLEPKVLINELKLDIVANVSKNGRENGNIYNSDGLSPTLCARDYKDPKKITEPRVSVVGNYSPSNHNASSIVDSNGIAPTVMENHGTITGVIVYDDYNSTIRKDQDTIGTLTTNIGNDAPRNGYKLIENQLRIRKLTPRECYRLMGFGDQAFDLAQPNQSNSSLYHQAGDSIVVNVLMELFRSLI
jgi:DNA (cytosine-5)-methyltransferase 1